MSNQQPQPDSNNDSELFSGFLAGRRSAPSPQTPAMSSARLTPHSGSFAGGGGVNEYGPVDFPMVNGNAGTAHTTSLYEHTGSDPFMSNDGSFNGASAMETGLAVMEAARVPPVTIGSGVPAKRGAAVLVQYADREVAAKRLKGDAQDGFLKWCSVSTAAASSTF